MVQVPEVADVMGRPLGEADLEGQALVGKTVRGYERLASAGLRVPVDGPAPHRTRRRRQRFVGEIDDLVVGVERDVIVHLVDDFDGVVGGLLVVERVRRDLAFPFQLAAHAVRRVEPPGDEIDHVGRELRERDDPDHRFPFAFALPAGFFGMAFFAAGADFLAAAFFAGAVFFAAAGLAFFAKAGFGGRWGDFDFSLSAAALCAAGGAGCSSSTSVSFAAGATASAVPPNSSSSRPRSSSSAAGRVGESACSPFRTSTVPKSPPPLIRSAFSRWRTFQSSCGSVFGIASSSKTRSMAATSATLRSPMPITLPLGTITVAPSSSRDSVTTSQFCPAICLVSTPVIRQIP